MLWYRKVKPVRCFSPHDPPLVTGESCLPSYTACRSCVWSFRKSQTNTSAGPEKRSHVRRVKNTLAENGEFVYWMITTTMKPTLLVMAAGIGSRYGGLKQIDPVGPNGEIIIDYSLYDAMRAGFGKVVFVIRRDIEADFKTAIGSKFEKRLPVEYAFQELDQLPSGFRVPDGRKKPWGTGQCILMAESLIREPFVAINADDFYGAGAFRVLADHFASGQTDYAMAGYVLRNTLSDHGSVARAIGDCDPRGFLRQVVERLKVEKDGARARYLDEVGQAHPLTGDELVSMNFWGFMPSVFGQLRRLFVRFLEKHGREEKSEFLIPTVVNSLVTEGAVRVKVLPTDATWFGVTYREDRAVVSRSIQALIGRGDYPSPLYSKG